MASEDCETIARLPVPNTNGLVIGATKNPGQVVGMKLNGPDIVQMSAESVEDMLEIPHLDFVIVSPAGKHAASRMKVNGTDWSVVFLEAI